MNAVSLSSHYDYTALDRRSAGVVEIHRVDKDSVARDRDSAKHTEQPALQGEIVEPDLDHHALHLRVRGTTLEGYVAPAKQAITSYRLHQTISPASIISPGRLLNAQA